MSRSNLAKYCTCHAESLAYLVLITYETSFTVRGATGVTIQPASHMKRHLQCAEQQVSRSNLTKYCTCHAESLAYLVLITYETSFTVRGATGVTIQPHQILRLPRKMTLLTYETSFPMRGATGVTIQPASHMKRHLQCAEQQVSRSNLTKYCTCHAESLAYLVLITYETSFTVRGATGVTIQPHQILRLPRKMTLLTYETSFPMRGATGVTIQPRQILRLPRKMTLQDVKENLQKQVKRHFQCGADPTMIRP